MDNIRRYLEVFNNFNRISSIHERTKQNFNTKSSTQKTIKSTDGQPHAGLQDFVNSMYAFTFVTQGISAVTGFADEMAGATAKVQQMSNELQSVNDIQNLIMQSAQRSGSSYTDIVDTVSRFSAMNDIFGSNNEAIAFTELMNKGLSANGVSKDAQAQLINQLAQSMSTGTMGVEDIQLMSQYIPDLSSGLQEYMNNIKGVEGNLQSMAAQGIITAEDIKNAMFMSSGQIEESFASAPMTFGQIWDRVMNLASLACIPLLGMINLLAQNWAWLGPIVLGVATTLGILFFAIKGVSIASAIAKTVTKGLTIAQNLMKIGYYSLSGSTQAATIAQNVFNSTLIASPIVWFILLIVGLISIIYAAVGAFNKLTGSSVSAAGIISGALSSVVGYIYNCFATAWNIIATFLNWLNNAFMNPVIAFKIFIRDMATSILGFILSVAKVIEDFINKIPGVELDLTSGIEKFKTKLEIQSETLKKENGMEDNIKKVQYKNLSEEFSKGYGVGEQFDNKVSSMFGIGNDPSAMFANGINPEDFARPTFGGPSYGGESDMEVYTRMLQQSSNNTTVPDYQFTDASAYSTGADITNEDFETMCADVALLREYVSKAVEENEPKEVNYYNTFNNSFTIHKEVDAKTVTDIIVSTISEAVNTSAESTPLLA